MNEIVFLIAMMISVTAVQGGIRLYQSGSSGANDVSTFYISSSAEMPSLTAQCTPTPNCQGKQISYSLTIQTSDGHPDNCSPLTLTSTTDPWNIQFPQVQGGTGTLTMYVNGHMNDQNDFIILGTQPSSSDVIAYINQQPGAPWYAQLIAKHETYNHHGGYQQFDDQGYPLPSDNHDGGYGIFQLTNPKPTCSQTWSWKENVEQGVVVIGQKQSYAQTWMTSQRQQAKDWNHGVDVPVPVHTDSKCTFQDGTSETIEDAVAMKAYNGASGGNYCAWDNANNVWKFNQNNNMGFDYVNAVCSMI